MSYILDALKKAERERAIAQVPTLMSVHNSETESPRTRTWITVVLCLLCLAALAWTAIYLLKQPPSQIASTVLDKDVVPLKHAQEAAVSNDPPLAAVPTGNYGYQETHTEPDNAASREIPPKSPPPPKRSISEAVHPALPRQPAETVAPIERRPVQPPVITKTITPPAPDGTSSTQAGQPAPASLHEAMAKMTMTILMYSEVASERMAFINDRKYVEGEYVEGRYLLESITPEGAVLSYQGERAILRSRAK